MIISDQIGDFGSQCTVGKLFSGQVWNTKATKYYHYVYTKLFFLAHSKTFIMTDPPCLCKDVKAHRIQNNFMIHFLSWKISNSQQVNFFSGQVWNTKATKDYHCVYNKLFFLAYSKTFIMTDPPCKAHRSKQAHWYISTPSSQMSQMEPDTVEFRPVKQYLNSSQIQFTFLPEKCLKLFLTKMCFLDCAS